MNDKYYKVIKGIIDTRIKANAKHVTFRFYTTTKKKYALYKSLIKFLEKNKLIYNEISGSDIEAHIIVKLDGRNTYVKKSKQSLKKEGK